MNHEPIHQIFTRTAKRFNSATALSYAGKQISYAELDEKSNRLANTLLMSGASKATVVAILADDVTEVIAAIIGTLKAGCAFMPMEAGLPARRLAAMIDVSRPGYLVADSNSASKISEAVFAANHRARLISLDRDVEQSQLSGCVEYIGQYQQCEASDAPEVESSPDDLSYIYFTSGTTGVPKAIAGRLKAIDHFIRWEIEELGLDERVRVSQLLPVTFDGSLRDIFVGLSTGGVVCVPQSREVVKDVRLLLRWMEEERVSLVHCVPSLMRAMLNEGMKQGELGSLRQVVMAGEALLPADVGRWKAVHGERVELINLYGTTETTMAKFSYRVREGDERRPSIPIGKPIRGAAAIIVDERGKPCSPKVVGEIYIRTPYRSLGYYNQPELTEGAFIQNPFSQDAEDIIYRTGDLGRELEGGDYEYLGRRDRQVKVRGVRVELAEIENLLRKQEGVKDVAVIDRQDTSGYNYLCAYLVIEEGVKIEEINQAMEEELSDYQVPSAYVEMEELPRTISGKVDSKRLPRPGESREGMGEYEAASSEVEQRLIRMWEEMLGVEGIGIRDNFFRLGGHSLMATQVVSRVREEYGVEVGLREMFECPTVGGLGERIEEGIRGGERIEEGRIGRASREGEIELSYAQQRLWFLDQLEPGSGFYNIAAAVRLTGELDEGALERTFSEMVRRHEVLRTRIGTIEGRPVQVISQAEAMKIEVEDISHLPEEEREMQSHKLVRDQGQKPFDLAVGPLIRVRLIRVGVDEHVLIVVMHHIISDGWSMGVMIREMAALYEAYREGKQSPLEELEIQYADYAVWQREYLQGDVLERQVEYWKKQLQGAPPLLELPTDRPRPAVLSYRGSQYSFAISDTLTQALAALCRHERVTMFMTLLAAFQLLLSKYSGQTDIIVGSPIAGRNRRETEPLIGFFVNNLVLRSDVNPSLTVTALLGSVRETALSAFTHQDVPFEMLVEQLQPERTLSYSPLFQVAFALHNTPATKAGVGEMKLAAVGVENPTAKFDLDLNITESRGGLVGAIEYNKDLFDEATMERMMRHLEAALAGMASEPGVRIGAMGLLSEAERVQQLYEWNDTSREYERGMSIAEVFEQEAERRPEATAVVSGGEQISYGELNRRANQLAHYLRKRGVGPEVLVGICVERSAEMVVAMLGVLKAGGGYVPLNGDDPVERLSYMLEETMAAVVVTQARLVEKLPVYWGQVIVIEQEKQEIEEQEEANAEAIAVGENVAYVMYTSGSTGKPKGVSVINRGVVRLVKGSQYVELGEREVMLQYAPATFDASTFEIWGALLNGGRLVVMPAGRATLEEIGRALKQESVTTLWLTAGLFHLMVDERVEELEGVRQVLAGGDVVSARHVKKYLRLGGDRKLINGYGPTEGTTFTCCNEVREESEVERGVAIGGPIANTKVYVLDGEMRLVPIGVAGELYIGGEGLARGYQEERELTATRFVPDPYSEEGGGRLYRTGDEVRWREEGKLEFVGRKDRQVKVRGYRVELAEVEAVLNEHRGVKQSVVIARERERGKELVGYVVERGEEVSERELIEYMEKRLPDYMVVRRYVRMERLPVTESGKVDRRRLPEGEEKREEGGGKEEERRTAIEEILEGIWGAVLGKEGIGVEESFFEIGGHSLLATQVVSRVREKLGVEVGLGRMFERPTIREMGEEVEERIRAEGKVEAPKVERVSREQEIGLSYAQQRLWFLDQLEPNSGFYNIAAAVRLTGELDEGALERTFSEMVRRHEVLRTSFGTIEGRPVQVIAPPSPIVIPVLDISEGEQKDRKKIIERLAREEAHRPFDLSQGPLLRVGLIKEGQQSYVMLLTMHHIVSDGWSMGVMIREMAALYEAYREGKQSPLEELEIQYADYAVWQREYLQGAVLERQVEYWKKQLQGAPPLLELPTDRPRPAVQTYRGSRLALSLPLDLSDGLRAVSRAESVTLFMTLLAAFQVLLSRYSGQTDILVSTGIANRTRAETESLIGFFVNTLVLRSDLSGNPSFRELLKQVREVTLGAYAHQDLPFEVVVEALQPERNTSYTPIFQVMIVLQNTPQRVEKVAGIELRGIEGEQTTAKFDLTMFVEEQGQEMVCWMEYNTDLFNHTTIQQMLRSYEQLLERLIQQPDTELEAIPMISLQQREQLKRAVAIAPHQQNILEMFANSVEAGGQRAALRCAGRQISYAELDEKSNQMANILLMSGASKGTVVAILAEDVIEVIAAIIGTLKAGCAFMPMEAGLPTRRMAAMIDVSRPGYLIADSNSASKISEAVFAANHRARLISLDRDVEQSQLSGCVEYIGQYQQCEASNAPEVESSPDDLSYIYFTSGTTGVPKAIAGRLKAIDHFIRWEIEELGLDERVRVSQLLPVTFDGSLRDIFVGLSTGGVVCVPQSREVVKDVRLLLRWMEEERVSLVHCVPSLMRAMLNEGMKQGELGSLRQVVMAGEALLPADVGRWKAVHGERVELINLYGTTETTMAKFSYRVREGDERRPSIPIGKPIRGAEAMLLNRKGEPCGAGTVGEIYIRTPYRSLGYYNQPELTEGAFIQNPFSQDAEDIIYRTGDLGRELEGGDYEYLGRRDRQVKVRGVRVELAEIENLLRKQEGVKDVAVIDRQDTSGYNYLCAYLVVEEGVKIEEINQAMEEELTDYQVPSAYVEMEELPRTISGKVDSKRLPRPGESREGMGEYEAASSEVEQRLIRMWEEMLGVEGIGIRDNFFRLGGHSLMATQVVSRVREEYGVEIGLREMFECPTVGGLGERIEEGIRGGERIEEGRIGRASREGEIELSYAQQRLWFLDQLEPGSGFYNIAAAVKLTGELDEGALERTFGEILRRHEVLRTRIGTIEGRPVQVISQAEAMKIEVEDISHLDEEEREIQARATVKDEAQRAFDLSAGPLIRVRLIRVGEDEHVLVVVMHHIISDGWSMGVMIREMAALYEAFREGRESPLAELEIQYADYAVWQREYLQGDVLERQVEYWRKQLQGAPPLLELPTDRPRPAVQTYRGSRVAMGLSRELSEGIRAVSKTEGVTLFMTMLAAFQVLLSRYSGQRDIVVGSPIAGRNRAEIEELIGFFVNTLVHRSYVRADQPFNHLLRQVREATLAAFAHQELPFEMLVEQMQPQRSLSHTPLFQVAFTLQNAPREQREVSGLTISAMAADNPTTKFDLTLYVMEARGRLVGEVEYNTDLFDPSSIERMMRSLEVMLEGVVADRTKVVGELAIMRESERRQVVEEWNDTSREYERGGSIQEAFELQVEQRGDAVAIKFEDSELTYKELNQRANQLAHHLRSLGVAPDTIVGLCIDRSLDLIVAILAILKAGGAYLPIDPAYPQDRIAFMLEDSEITVLITQDHLVNSLPDHQAKLVRIDEDWQQIAQQSRENPKCEAKGENLAYIIYTSGSTGQPKGVMVTHSNVVRLLRATEEKFGFRETDVWTMFHSASFDFSVWELWGGLCYGGKVVVVDYWMSRTAEAFYEMVESEAVTVLNQTPSAFRQFMQIDEERAGELRLRVVIFGGEALEVGSLRGWVERHGDEKPELVNMYGITETTVHVTYRRLTRSEIEAGAGSVIGGAIGDLRVYILDEEGQVVPEGVGGEIYVGGRGLARGYKGRAELTAERFVPDEYSGEAGGRLYKSGDRGRYVGRGEIEYLGRIDNQVKIRGFRIELGEIESALMGHAGVREAVVVARSEESGEKRLVGYVVAEKDHAPTTNELKQHLGESLPEYMIPSVIVMLEDMPLTANGKVDRQALPEPKRAETEYEAPTTATEEILANIWADVLRVERVGREENFFELGGHSLLATQLISRVRETFEVETTLRQLFERPTVAELAKNIDIALGAGGEKATPAIERVSREQEIPLSYAQQRLWFLDQLEPGSGFYNIPAAVRLTGELDEVALERTFSEMVRRHEVLRTRIGTIEGRPVQVISQAEAMKIEIEDISHLPEEEREKQSHNLVRDQGQKPFDLAAGPLIRVRLIRVGEDEHVLVVVMHHIISDGWSMGVMIRELAALYEAYREGRESPLEELEIQYADYAVWQREYLQGDVLDRQVEYWKKQLQGAPPLLELPTDRPRPAVLSYRGSQYSFAISDTLTQALAALCRHERVTMFMTLLAAFQLLLSKYSGQTDIIVGSPIAGRNRRETEPLIGFFVNNLVLRSDVNPSLTVTALLGSVRETALSAFTHQDVPFEMLVEQLQPERTLSYSPLFQVAFALHNTPATKAGVGEMKLAAVGVENPTAKFDLDLNITESRGGLVGAIEYNKDLFDETTMERMMRHLEAALAGMASEPGVRIGAMGLLSEAERVQQLYEWNDTSREYERGMSIAEVFEQEAERRPEATAVVSGGEQISYGELNRRANQLAHYLRKRGVGPEVLVGICVERSAEMVVAMLGVLKAGGGYVPLNGDDPVERLSYMLEETMAAVVVTQARLVEKLPVYWGQVIVIEQEKQEIEEQEEANAEAIAVGENVAYVMYTSGSTGKPKGVSVINRGVVRLVKGSQYVELGEREVMLQYAPATFDASTFEIWGALLNGGRLVVMPAGRATLEEIGRALRQESVTTLWLTAGLFHLMVDERVEELEGVRQVLAGGDVVSARHVKKYLRLGGDRKLINGYGPTEGTTFTCCNEVREESEVERGVAIGGPIANTKVYVLDGEMRLVPIGVAGELYIGGEGLARGYQDEGELTASMFVPDPYSEEGGGRLYRTGDEVRWREEGKLEFVGRRDRQVKVRGYRVELAEVEAVLNEHRGVKQSVVIARERERGKELVGYVVERGEEVSERELIEYMEKRLPDYMVVRRYMRMERLPVTESGKVDRRRLPEEEEKREEGGKEEERRTAIEEILEGIWGAVLGKEEIGVEENFFEIGGHSLLATQVVSRVREKLGVEVGLGRMFERPTIREMGEEVEERIRAEGKVEAPKVGRASREGEIELSYAQQRLWFLDQLEPNSVFYNIPAAVKLTGELDEKALERTFGEIVRRHEVLRTSFGTIEGRPVQVISQAEAFKIEVEDISHLPEEEREIQAGATVIDEAQRAFDLSAGPLIRVRLIRTGADEHVLVVVMHHIISDGWSMGVMIREMAVLYEAYREGKQSPLEELEIQYADYAVWQREYLQGDVLDRQVEYWRKQLQGAPPLLELPTDRPRPAVQTYRGACVYSSLPQELSDGLRSVSRAESVTLFMTLLAAFQVLLSRYSRQSDIIIGSPIANRTRAETEPLIGFFVNTLVHRSYVRADQPFNHLLRQVREATLAAFAHQELPFEMLVEQMQPQRSLSHTPLFQVAFTLQNAPREQREVSGLTISAMAADNPTTKFDLTLYVMEARGRLVGEVEYNTDLFDPSSIERMMRSLEVMLEGVVADRTKEVGELAIMRESERRQVVEEWNDTSREYERGGSIQEAFELQVEQRGDAAAVKYEGRHLSYRELNERANQLAHHLRRLGVGSEVMVGIYLGRGVEIVVAIMGILKAGGVFVPIDPTYPQERKAYMMEDAGLAVVVSEERMVEGLPASWAQVVCLDTDREEIERNSRENPAVEVIGENGAYLIYTSGSTGKPKGVVIEQGGVVNLSGWQGEEFEVRGGSRISQYASYSFDAAIGETMMALLNGGELVMLKREEMSGERLMEEINEEEIDVIVLVPSVIKGMEASRLRRGKEVRVVAVGEACPAEMAEEWGRRSRFINAYGPTEYTVYSHLWEVEVEEVKRRGTVAIGRPIGNTASYILDERMREVCVGVDGEIYIAGAGIGRGYIGRAAETAESFIPNPFDKEGNNTRMYKTGDLGRYLPDGRIEYRGRIDNQVKIRGFRIEVGEIEALLKRETTIKDCVVEAVTNERGDKELVAYVVTEGRPQPTPSEIRSVLKQRVPEYMVPAKYVMMEELPLTGSGKIDRGRLPKPERREGEARAEMARARSEVERMLEGVWEEILGEEEIGAEESFFEIGGHSLLATQVVSRIREIFGIEIGLGMMFEEPTIRGMGEKIEAGMRRGEERRVPGIERVSREQALPLSFAQQRLWLVDQLAPNSAAYNVPTAVRLTGYLDIQALDRSINQILSRHEVLRTSFLEVEGRPVQLIAPFQQMALKVIDLSESSEQERQAEAYGIAAKEAKAGFDLSEAPLLRATVMKLGEEDHVLVVVMHHIVSDGWSMGVMIREMAVLYEAYREGRESPLEELEIQYADYAVWQREYLQGEVLERQVEYWKKQLQGAPPLLELPTDRPRPAVQSYRGSQQGIGIGERVSEGVRELSRREGVTLFMTMLAAFQVLLSKYTGQRDVVVGSPIAGRNRAEIESLIGFFVNTLVLRSDLSGNPSFRELLKQVREVTLGAYAHQDLPFEMLVEQMQPERNLSHTPLFQVAFTLQNAPREQREVTGLKISPIGVDNLTTKFDITFSLVETHHRLNGRLEYNTDLFDDTTISRMVKHFEVLLESMIYTPEQRLSELSMLSETEKHQLLFEWNETAREYPEHACIHELFEQQSALTPDAVAVIFEQQHLRYAELNQRANQLGHYLRELGVGPEVSVGICVERSIEMVVGLLGILKAGGAYVPIDPSYPQQRISFMLEDAGVSLLLTQKLLVDSLPQHNAKLICLDQWDDIATRSHHNLEITQTSQNLAYVMYTSGSTGNPKGTSITHQSVARLVKKNYYARLDSQEVFLQLAPITFDASTFEIWGALLNGGRLVVMPAGRATLEEIGRVLKQESVTTLWLTAGLFHLMVDERVEELEGVRQVLAGGDVVSARHVKKYLRLGGDRKLINGYGPTEGTTFTCCNEVREESEVERGVAIGGPIANTKVYVLDGEMRLVPIGVVGELYIGGEGLARGYQEERELTATRFVPDPYSEEGGGRLYRTGDEVRWREEGKLEFVGRRDRQVKVRGYRVELAEVETALASHAGVREAVVVARSEESGEKRLVGYVVAEKDHAPTTNELKQHLGESLPEYMIPSVIVMLEDMPLTANGKVDRRALPEPMRAETEYEAPTTATEEILANIWADVLRVERVGREENFFELGGHSLLATQLISRVRETFEVEIELRKLFERPTVVGLAQSIDAGMRRGEERRVPGIERVSRDQALPLSFAQQRLWLVDQLAPNSAAYNVPTAVRLTGYLDIQALDRSINQILSRHEVLRTSFLEVEGRPVQLIAPFQQMALRVIDLSESSEQERQAEAYGIAAEEAKAGFDLSEAPLLRATVMKLGEEDHVLVVVMHHIVSDGWSMGVMIREMAALYEAYREGRESPLEELEIQYADYAVWQREYLQGEVLERQVEYWRKQLEGAPPLLELPTDRPRPAVQSYRGSQQGIGIGERVSEGVRELSRREGVTLFMTMLAAFQVLLSRYSGQTDILVSTGIANRTRAETESLIGFFVNTLVLRSDLSGNPSFRELLKQVREVTLGAYAHQDLPFEVVVEALQPERSTSYTPIFQVMIVLQNAPQRVEKVAGIELRGIEGEQTTAKFDLTMFIEEQGQEMVCWMEYNTDLFNDSTITRLLGYFQVLLQSIVEDPDGEIETIPMITEEESQQLVEAWS